MSLGANVRKPPKDEPAAMCERVCRTRYGEGVTHCSLNRRTRLQPVHADDVSKAACTALRDVAARSTTSEIGGPASFTLREIIEMILAAWGAGALSRRSRSSWLVRSPACSRACGRA